ncbi:DUF3107 domain-containing protein [Brooklawnia sp.]|uniref:DUF3107 domain-containing protein n=1 Tax=Brooklawnia sp. TaxID=2699740 RepID=UPI00311F3178
MEIKIGVRNIGRELNVETDQTAEQIEKNLREAGTDGLLVIEATQGRKVLLPTAAIGYVDLGQEIARPVGFGFSGQPDATIR